jgi:hypothetical protein
MAEQSQPMLVALPAPQPTPQAAPQPAPGAGNPVSGPSLKDKKRKLRNLNAKLDAHYKEKGAKEPPKPPVIEIPSDTESVTDSEDEQNGAKAPRGQPPVDSEVVANTDSDEPDEPNGAKEPSGQPPVVLHKGSWYTQSTSSE